MATAATDAVFETVAQALAGLKQPDLSGFDEVEVWNEMAQLLTPGSQELGRLRDRVAELSGGLTRLQDADPEEFAWRSKELGAVYQRLQGLFIDRLVIMGNSEPQFLFVPHRH